MSSQDFYRTKFYSQNVQITYINALQSAQSGSFNSKFSASICCCLLNCKCNFGTKKQCLVTFRATDQSWINYVDRFFATFDKILELLQLTAEALRNHVIFGIVNKRTYPFSIISQMVDVCILLVQILMLLQLIFILQRVFCMTEFYFHAINII